MTPDGGLADRVRAGLSVVDVQVRRLDALLVVTVRGRDRDGREEVALATTVIGADPFANEAQLEATANAAREWVTQLLRGVDADRYTSVPVATAAGPAHIATGNPPLPRPDAVYCGWEADADGPFHLWRVAGVDCWVDTRNGAVVLRSYERCPLHDRVWVCLTSGTARWAHRHDDGVCRRTDALRPVAVAPVQADFADTGWEGDGMEAPAW